MQTDILKKKGVNKYLVFDSRDEKKELIKKYNDDSNRIQQNRIGQNQSAIMKKITSKLNLILMIIYH